MTRLKPYTLNLTALSPQASRKTRPNKIQGNTYAPPHPVETPQPETWWDKQDVMQHLHISSRTLQRWRSKGLITYSKIGGKIFYSKTALEDLLKKGVLENGFK